MPTLNDALEGLKDVEEDVKKEAKAILVELGLWAFTELKPRELGDAPVPTTGGGDLDGMSLDEALARADNLDASLGEKIKIKAARRKIAQTVVEKVLSIVITALVTAGSRSLG